MNYTDELLMNLYKIFDYDKDKDNEHQKTFTKEQVIEKVSSKRFKDQPLTFKKQSISTTLGQLVKFNRLGKKGNDFYLNHDYKYEAIQEVESFQDFKDKLEDFRDDNPGKRLFFRGECGLYEYRIPSMYRHKYVEVTKHSDRFYSELLSNLGDLNLLKEPRTTQLSRLQHFNAPTRMLDITTNPLVALYFAVEKTNEKKENHRMFFYAVDPEEIKYEFGHTALLKASVNWMNQEIVNEFITKYKSDIPTRAKEDIGNKFLKGLNEVSNSSLQFTNLDNIYEDLTSSTFVEFVKESTRMKNQSGAFIMPLHLTRLDNDDEKNQNKLVDNSIVNKFLVQDNSNKYNHQYKEVIIKHEFVPEIKKYLSVLGINSGYIYPDIENYSKYLIDAHYNPNDNYKE